MYFESVSYGELRTMLSQASFDEAFKDKIDFINYPAERTEITAHYFPTIT